MLSFQSPFKANEAKWKTIEKPLYSIYSVGLPGAATEICVLQSCFVLAAKEPGKIPKNGFVIKNVAENVGNWRNSKIYY